MGRRALVGFLLLLGLAAPARAQDAPPAFVSAPLEPGHWAVGAIRRLDGLGLLPAGFDAGVARPTARDAAWMLRSAARADRPAHPELARLANDYWERFREEFGATERQMAEGARPAFDLEGTALGGIASGDGRLLAGRGYDGESWTGPAPDEEDGWAGLGGRITVDLGRYAAVHASRAPTSAGRWTEEIHFLARLGPVAGWLGRRAPGFGPGTGGRIVLGGEAPVDGLGLGLADPVRLPGFLRALGPVRFETFLARLDRNGPVEAPLFWGARGAVAPHPRLKFGITRAAIFGGEGGEPVTLRSVATMLVGVHGTGGGTAENQVVAADVWYRVPVEAVPVVAYMEWGFEDSAGAWKNVPGIVAGLRVPAVPGVPALSVGLERAHFARSCCANPIWYRHMFYRDGWTAGQVPIGHPLGGHGDEWTAHARADLAGARLRLDGRVFRRDRGAENLFAPDRLGRSRGAALTAAYRWTPRLELEAAGQIETGEKDWDESYGRIGLRLAF